MTTPNPPEFPPETQFRVSWEMPPANLVAYREDRDGGAVWGRMGKYTWAALPWRPSENITDDYEQALDQFRQLSAWAESHQQPIRNVKLEWRKPPQWAELDAVPGGAESPTSLPSFDIPAGGGGRFA